MLKSFGLLAGLGTLLFVAAKTTVLVTAYVRRTRKKAEQERLRLEADDSLTMEFGFETQVEQPTLETVERAIDRMGLPGRSGMLVLVSGREDYVQADFVSGGRYVVEARQHPSGKARQYVADRGRNDDPLDSDDVKAIFAEFMASRSLNGEYNWRDITGRH